MAANALSAPPKCRHFPWQGSQHQTWLKRSRSRLQSLGAHSLGTESHRIEQVNIRGVLRPPPHLVCQLRSRKANYVFGVCSKGSTKIDLYAKRVQKSQSCSWRTYLHMPLCVDSALVLSAISNTFYGFHIFHGRQTTTNPLLQSMAFFEFDCVSGCSLDSLPS